MPISDHAEERVLSPRLVATPQRNRTVIAPRFPPEPPIRVAGELDAELQRARRALCRLDGALEAVPNLEPFVATRLRQEAVLSAGLAGWPTSLPVLVAAEVGMLDAKDSSCSAPALRCLRAMQHGLIRVREQPLDGHLLGEVHHRLLEGELRPGSAPPMRSDARPRIEPESRAIDEAGLQSGRPAAAEAGWEDVADFFRQRADLPVVIRIGLALAQFDLTRPFRAGSGRMGRLLAALLLHQYTIVREPVLLVSRILPSERSAPQDPFPQSGDWEAWLVCFLHGIAAACAASMQAVRRFAKLREAHRAALGEHLGHAVGRGLLVLDHLYSRPVVTAGGVGQITGTSYVAANQLVSRFVDLGILEEITGHRRNRQFRYGPYLRIFESDSTEWSSARKASKKHSPPLRTARPPDSEAARAKPESIPSMPQRRTADGKPSGPRPTQEYVLPRSSGPEPISDDLL